jgi:hypothetical protein
MKPTSLLAIVLVILIGAWALNYMQKRYTPTPSPAPIDTRTRGLVDPGNIVNSIKENYNNSLHNPSESFFQ